MWPWLQHDPLMTWCALGIEVVHHGTMFHLNQHKYTQDLLIRTAMLDSKPATSYSGIGRTNVVSS